MGINNDEIPGIVKIAGEDDTITDVIDNGDGVNRFAVDIGGVQVINPQVAGQVFTPFSPWSAKAGTNDYIPFEFLQYETQLAMHDATLDVSSTATAGTATTLTDNIQNWTVNEFDGAIVKITAGTGLGQWREVQSNTSDTLTVSGWDVTPDATSVYYVSKNNSKLVAPIDGIYSVKSHCSVAYQAGVVGMFIYVNGVFKALNYEHQGQNIEMNGDVDRDIQLSKDDEVQIKLYIGGATPQNMFGGEARLWFSMHKV